MNSNLAMTRNGKPSASQTCPSRDEIGKFSRNELPEIEAALIFEHLNCCQDCWDWAEGLPADSSVIESAREANRARIDAQVDVQIPIERLNQIVPNYEIVREIGRGGMGVVYEARHVKLNQAVALKVLPALLSAVHPEAIARFRREAVLSARLKHNNIIGVHDFVEIDGTCLYAMDLIDGPSLRHLIEQIQQTGTIDIVLRETSQAGSSSFVGESPPTTRVGSTARPNRLYYRQIAIWIAEVAEALHYAHCKGVLHRDIKPANLLLNMRDNRVMVSDFGLAWAECTGSITSPRSLLGTARYMSPEQLDEHRAAVPDRRSDVYSLGATMYELLSFRPMFEATDAREVLNKVLHDEPVPPRRFIKDVPHELETICLKAAEKSPEARYPSAAEMAEDLRRWLLDLPIRATRPSFVSRGLKLVKRHKVITTLLMIIAMMGASTGLIVVRLVRSDRAAHQVAREAEEYDYQGKYFEALSDWHSGRPKSALASLDGTISAYPDRVDLHLIKARFLLDRNRVDDGISYLTDFVAHRPESWACHLFLANIYTTLRTNPDKIEYHRECSSQRTSDDSSHRYYLEALCAAGDKDSIGLLFKSLDRDPNNISAILYRSELLWYARRYTEMLVDAERAASLRPRWPIVHGLVGNALGGLKRWEDADVAMSRAIELDPKSSQWRVQRSRIRMNLKRPAEALTDADAAIDFDHEYGQAYLARANAHGALGEVHKALEDINSALRNLRDVDDFFGLAPGKAESVVFFRRAMIYGRYAKEFDRAVEDLDRVASICPNDQRVNWWRATFLQSEARYDDAIEALTSLITADPGHTDARFRRAFLLEHQGHVDKALEDYRVLAESMPQARMLAFTILVGASRKEEAELLLDPLLGGDGWSVQLARLLLGERQLSELLSSAMNDSERSLAYFYAGRRALAEKSTAVAASLFSKCCVHGGDAVEIEFARLFTHHDSVSRSLQDDP